MGNGNNGSPISGNDSFARSMLDSAKLGSGIFVILAFLGLVLKLIFRVFSLVAKLAGAGWSRCAAGKKTQVSGWFKEAAPREEAAIILSPADQLRIAIEEHLRAQKDAR